LRTPSSNGGKGFVILLFEDRDRIFEVEFSHLSHILTVARIDSCANAFILMGTILFPRELRLTRTYAPNRSPSDFAPRHFISPLSY